MSNVTEMQYKISAYFIFALIASWINSWEKSAYSFCQT